MQYKITKEDKAKNNPQSLITLANKYLLSRMEKNYTWQTLQGKKYFLNYFINWCYENHIYTISEISKKVLENHIYFLQNMISKRTKKKLSHVTIVTRISNINCFFTWITNKNYIINNPAKTITVPKQIKTLPKNILSIEEAEQIINTPDITTDIGIRDRAMLELFYSSGIRRAELVNLNVSDIDFERGILLILEGKYKQDRYIPVTERALKWLEKYIYQARPNFLVNQNEKRLFITKDGHPFAKLESITSKVRKYIKKAKISKPVACHIFRHTMATLMLENGADIRYIMELLGHTLLSSTKVYTKVSITKLSKVHALTHPANIEERAIALGECNEI